MQIEYDPFGYASILFSPERDDREIMLEILKVLHAKTERKENIVVYQYFIDKLERELESGVQ